MFRPLITPLALAATLLSGAAVQAAPVTFNGFANGAQSINVALSAPNSPLVESGNAGGLLANVPGIGNVVTYCVDLYQSIDIYGSYNDYTLVSGAAHQFANANALLDIGKLYSEEHSLNNANRQAAFQIAIWEIAYETSGSYNLASGSIRFGGGSADPAAYALASNWLGELAGTTNRYNISVLESPRQQDQLFATAAVPEPTSIGLTAGGLFAMGWARRRRAAQRG